MAGLLAQSPGHCLPEPSLDLPPILLREAVIPLRHVLLAVAGKAGDVQVDAGFLGQGHQQAQTFQVHFIGLLRGNHELGDLEVNPGHVRPKLFHFPKVFFDLGPLLVPVVLQQTARFIVVVVESPRHERLGGIGQDEAVIVVGNPHPRHFAECDSACDDSEEDKHERSVSA